jgi:hypothetical protein
MTATGELVAVEVRPNRKARIILEKFAPGPILAMVAPASSFFYRVSINGDMRTCTEDPLKAREVFRECCRWAVTV